jgi:hypothetical protein
MLYGIKSKTSAAPYGNRYHIELSAQTLSPLGRNRKTTLGIQLIAVKSTYK